MLKCKTVQNFKRAKKDIIGLIMFSFSPLPETLEKMDGIKLAIPFSNGRRIIMSFVNEENDFKITLELELRSSNIEYFTGRTVGIYDKKDNPEKSIEECLNLIIDKVYSF